jgi:hypothetical protein
MYKELITHHQKNSIILEERLLINDNYPKILGESLEGDGVFSVIKQDNLFKLSLDEGNAQFPFSRVFNSLGMLITYYADIILFYLTDKNKQS